MSTNWMAINAGLNAGLNTWNQLGWLRQAGQDSQIASDTKDAQASAQTDIDNYKTAAKEAKDYNNSDFGKLATSFGVDANDKEAQDRFRNQAIEGGWVNDNDNSVNWDKVNEQYGRPVDPQSSGDSAIDSEEAAIRGHSGPEDNRAGWMKDISNNIENRDQTAQKANAAINQDLVQSIKDRTRSFGNQAAEIRKSSDRWWNRDRLSEDEGYGTSAGFKFFASQLDKGDPEALQLMADAYNAGSVNGERIQLNDNGKFTLYDGQGNVLQDNFTPSKVQMGDQLARVYNLNKFFETGKLQEYINGKTGLANADSAVAASRVNNMKARVAETYGMSNAEAENTSNRAEAAINVDKADISNRTKDGVVSATNATNNTTAKYSDAKAQAELAALRNKAAGGGRGSGGGRGGSGKAAPSGDGLSYKDAADGGQDITLANGKRVGYVSKDGRVLSPQDRDGKTANRLFNSARAAHGSLVSGVAWDPEVGAYVAELRIPGQPAMSVPADNVDAAIAELQKHGVLPKGEDKPINTKPKTATAIPPADDMRKKWNLF